MLLTRMELCYTKLVIATHWGCSVATKCLTANHYCCLCIFLGISMPFTKVSLHHTRLPTSAHWCVSEFSGVPPTVTMFLCAAPSDGSVWSQVFYQHFLGYMCAISDISLFLPRVNFHHPTFFQCDSLEWLCFILIFQCHLIKLLFLLVGMLLLFRYLLCSIPVLPQILSEVALFSFRCCTAILWS